MAFQVPDCPDIAECCLVDRELPRFALGPFREGLGLRVLGVGLRAGVEV